MGMTERELLRQVELPLALPSIIAGIRVAAVVGVGCRDDPGRHRRRRTRTIHLSRPVDGGQARSSSPERFPPRCWR